jgi:hypothetical protein
VLPVGHGVMLEGDMDKRDYGRLKVPAFTILFWLVVLVAIVMNWR